MPINLKEITLAQIGKSVAIAVVCGVLLYVAVYFMASHGDAFEFAEQAIKNSRSLQTQIGKVERVRLAPSGGYHEKFVNSDAWVMMKVEVTGTAQSVALDMKVKKTDGNWSIEQVLLDGKPVTLN